VALLREHLAAGRLTADEFGERMELALGAKTFGDLAPLLDDLPDQNTGQLVTATTSVAPPAWSTPAAVSRRGSDRWTLRLAVSGATLTIYLVLGLTLGVWWFPWFAIVVPVLLIRHMR